MTREVSIERYLIECVKRNQGLCLKLVPFSLKGVPDRLMVLPGPVVVFVEVKRPKGGRIDEHQHFWRQKLLALGCLHRFVSTKAEVDALMEELTNGS